MMTGKNQPELTGIQNIILDLGGVILDLDPDRTVHAFLELGFPEGGDIKTVLSKYPFFLQSEIGAIDPPAFRQGIRDVCGNHISDEAIDAAWNAMLRGFGQDAIDTVRSLGKRHALYLLSNTNEIHELHYNRQLAEQHGVAHLRHLFRDVYYSHEMKMRKPDAAIFEFVLKDAGLSPCDTLFIDDSKANVDAAVELGIHGFHLKPPIRLSEAFREALT